MGLLLNFHAGPANHFRSASFSKTSANFKSNALDRGWKKCGILRSRIVGQMGGPVGHLVSYVRVLTLGLKGRGYPDFAVIKKSFFCGKRENFSEFSSNSEIFLGFLWKT